jgi:hypothetical protein
MQAVFHTKKVSMQSQNIFRPFFLTPELIIVSTAISKGQKPISNNGPVYGIGGHASQRITALSSANK